jgi:Macrocin-O-methyltransferase (TylF)
MQNGFKSFLARVGGHLSAGAVHKLNAAVNYLETGRWMRQNGFHPSHRFATKREFWNLLRQELGERVVLYLEFGVWEGETTRYVAQSLDNPQNRLHGFDSFEGLPERWNHAADAGCFSTRGALPQIDDSRVEFHKGWFQQTLADFDLPSHEVLVINLDADLYSSTIYVLNHLEGVIVPGTYLYFDEFSDRHHELRAFDEFLGRTQMRFELLAATPAFDKVLFRRALAQPPVRSGTEFP